MIFTKKRFLRGNAFRLLLCSAGFAFLLGFPAFAKSNVVARTTIPRTDAVDNPENSVSEIVARPTPATEDERYPNDVAEVYLPEDGLVGGIVNGDPFPELYYDVECEDEVRDVRYVPCRKGIYYVPLYRDDGGNYRMKLWYYSVAEVSLTDGVPATAVVYEQPDGYSYSQFIRIVVPRRGWIKVDVTPTADEICYPLMSVYVNKGNSYPEAGTFGSAAEYEPAYVAVDKGAYYVQVCNVSGAFRVKYSFHAYKDKNFTKKKAKKLKRGKTATAVVYTKDKKKKWKRYFSITLKKKQRVKIVIESPYGGVGILNSKGRYVPTVSDSGDVSYSRNKLKKGKYYLVVDYDYDFLRRKKSSGDVVVFKWM